jgi:hypothetical protein
MKKTIFLFLCWASMQSYAETIELSCATQYGGSGKRVVNYTWNTASGAIDYTVEFQGCAPPGYSPTYGSVRASGTLLDLGNDRYRVKLIASSDLNDGTAYRWSKCTESFDGEAYFSKGVGGIMQRGRSKLTECESEGMNDWGGNNLLDYLTAGMGTYGGMVH